MSYLNFFDFETTGTNPVTAEIITGYVETYHRDDLCRPVDSLYIECRPEKYVDAAFPFHKIPRERAMNFPDPEIGLRLFYKHLLKYPDTAICHANHFIYGKTGYFDWTLLKDYCTRKGSQDWFHKNFHGWKVESTHTIAKKVLPLVGGYSLDNLAEHFLIKFEHHNCIQDVKAMIIIYKKLQEYGKTLFDFMEVK